MTDEDVLMRAREVVRHQAVDIGLWSIEPKNSLASYLQQELRRLHAVLEDKIQIECMRNGQ